MFVLIEELEDVYTISTTIIYKDKRAWVSLQFNLLSLIFFFVIVFNWLYLYFSSADDHDPVADLFLMVVGHQYVSTSL